MDKETRYVGVKETLSYGLANAGQVFGYNLIAGGYLSLFFTKVYFKLIKKICLIGTISEK